MSRLVNRNSSTDPAITHTSREARTVVLYISFIELLSLGCPSSSRRIAEWAHCVIRGIHLEEVIVDILRRNVQCRCWDPCAVKDGEGCVIVWVKEIYSHICT